jgi:hypothetical protein
MRSTGIKFPHRMTVGPDVRINGVHEVRASSDMDLSIGTPSDLLAH